MQTAGGCRGKVGDSYPRDLHWNILLFFLTSMSSSKKLDKINLQAVSGNEYTNHLKSLEIFFF